MSESKDNLDVQLLQAKWVLGGVEPEQLVQAAVLAEVVHFVVEDVYEKGNLDEANFPVSGGATTWCGRRNEKPDGSWLL